MTNLHPATILTILQQSEYDLNKVAAWRIEHPQYEILEPEKWTLKLRLIQRIYALCGHTWFGLQLGVWLTSPAEWVIRLITYTRAQRKLQVLRKKGVVVIVVAGSYAKTSTKQWLAHLLSGEKKVCSTPKSINTALGIARWILHEVDPTSQALIIELGEYHPGDLRTLCNLITPDYGILTPIGPQHLEMLGGQAGIDHEFSDYLTWFDEQGKIGHCLSHDTNNSIINRFSTVQQYGTTPGSKYTLRTATITRAGTEAELAIPESAHSFTPLLGSHQVVNALPAFWLAEQIQLNKETIRKRMASMPYISRRHEPTFAANNVLILDNSYNTNAASIDASLELLQALQPTRSFVVTLGFTETGREVEQLHIELGKKLAAHAEYVGLIDAPWTPAITKGWLAANGKSNHVVTASSQQEAFQKLQEWVIPGSVVLFEGGFQEVYLHSAKQKEQHGEN